MKKKLSTVVTIGFTTVYWLGCSDRLSSEKEKASYALGQEIGTQWKKRNIDLDFEVLELSLNEFADGKPSRMSSDEMAAALQILHTQIEKTEKAVKTESQERQEQKGITKATDETHKTQ